MYNISVQAAHRGGLYSQPKKWLNDRTSMPFSHRLVDYQETGEIHIVHEVGSIYNEK